MSRYILILFLFISINAVSQQLGDSNAIVYSMDLHPEAKMVVALVDARRTVEVWNLKTLQLVKRLSLDRSGDLVSISGNTIAIALEGGFIELYDTVAFGKTPVVKISDDSKLVSIKSLPNGFIVADSKGNVIVFGNEATGVTTRKLFTSSEPITGFDVLPERNIVLTGHADGKFSLWSLADGTLIRQQKFGSSDNFMIASDGANESVFATFQNGNVESYIFDPNNSLIPFDKFHIRNWPVALDIRQKMCVVGTTAGLLNVYSGTVSYTRKIGAMVNFARFIPSQSSQIKIVIGTQGKGIRVVEAKDMKVEN